ncbi:TPA: hypothetical protein ACH3X3_011503 [Trebouxia sp. C0006]
MSTNRIESFEALQNIISNPSKPVAQVCQAIDECISCNWDNLRGFFELCFPLLVKNLFGYDGPSWLSAVAQGNQAEDAKALVQLLGPAGNLFTAMDLADRDKLIEYVFPDGRLPVMTQILLKDESGQKELDRWPQYQGRLVPGPSNRKYLHMNTLQYFLLWTAFYVLRSGQSSTGQSSGSRRPVFASATFGNMRKHMQATAGKLVKGQQQTTRSHPYQTLLQLYLSRFLPRGGDSRSGKAGQHSRGEMLFSILMEFWLTDGDDPFLRNPKQDRVSVAAPYDAPTTDLLEAMQELVRYSVAICDGEKGQQPPRWAQATVRSWLPLSPLPQLGPPQHSGPPRLMAAGQPPFQSFAKRLYRFMRRAITRWPEQRPVQPLISLYIAYIAPWGLTTVPEPTKQSGQGSAGGTVPLTRQLHNMEGLVHRVLRDKPNSSPSDKDIRPVPQFQLGQWEGHVLASLPFYMLLLPLLLSLLKSRVASKATSALQDLAKVLVVFKAAPELCNLLRAVEEEYTKAREQHKSRVEGPHADVLPWIQAQAAAFESAASASVRDAPTAHAEAPQFVLFSRGERGGAAQVRNILNRAVGAQEDVIRQVEECALGWLPMDKLGQTGDQHAPQPAPPLPAMPTVKKATIEQLHFKGDPMHRPVMSREVGFLVQGLVKLSEWLNHQIGLDQPAQEGEMAETQIQDVLLWLRRKGYRINLRGLAERQTLWWIGIIIFVVWGFCWLCSLISGMSNGDSVPDEIQVERLEAQRRYMSSHPSTYRFDARNPSTFYAKQEHNNL